MGSSPGFPSKPAPPYTGKIANWALAIFAARNLAEPRGGPFHFQPEATQLIRYHGTPITPSAAAVQILRGRHGMVSFAYPEQIEIVAEVCQSFVLDNGAFTAWKQGKQVDWNIYYNWVNDWVRHPGFAWFLIPDIIDGDEAENRSLINDFSENPNAVPVWHLHESLAWLEELVSRFRVVALGSSGDYSEPGTDLWYGRMDQAMQIICDEDGRPRTRIHGLRMMDPTIFSRYPFASVDSTNVARNIGMDSKWDRMPYGKGLARSTRGVIMADRCEGHAAAAVWVKSKRDQYRLLFG